MTSCPDTPRQSTKHLVPPQRYPLIIDDYYTSTPRRLMPKRKNAQRDAAPLLWDDRMVAGRPSPNQRVAHMPDELLQTSEQRSGNTNVPAHKSPLTKKPKRNEYANALGGFQQATIDVAASASVRHGRSMVSTLVLMHNPWKCTHSQGCMSVRSTKRTGEYHMFCEYHADQVKLYQRAHRKKLKLSKLEALNKLRSNEAKSDWTNYSKHGELQVHRSPLPTWLWEFVDEVYAALV